MNSKVGLKTLPAAQSKIETDDDRNISRKMKQSDRVGSEFEGLHLFSDRSRVAMKVGELAPYTLHLTLLNFTGKYTEVM